MLQNCIKPFLKPTLIPAFKLSFRKYTPRRALLYVPADDQKKVLKAFDLDVDCICLDCEDGVAHSKKSQARLNIRELLDKGKPVKKRNYDFAVRVNSMSSGLLKDDLSVILTGKHLPNTMFLPKVECEASFKMFSDHLDEFVKTNVQIGLIIGIESAVGLMKAADLCSTAVQMAEISKFKPVALLFGSDDYVASIGATRTETCDEIIYARQKIVSVAKAFNLQAIDMVYIKYKDLEGLKKNAQQGALMGYTGKQVIHPGQIEITQKAFLPSKQTIDWAKDIMKAFHKHQQDGQGAFVYKGSMIDMPTMRQAQNILELVNAIMIQQ